MGWNYCSRNCKSAADCLQKANWNCGITQWSWITHSQRTWSGFPRCEQSRPGGHGRYQPSFAAAASSCKDMLSRLEEKRSGNLQPRCQWYTSKRVLLFAAFVAVSSETPGNECMLHSGCHVINSVKTNSQSTRVTNIKHQLGIHVLM